MRSVLFVLEEDVLEARLEIAFEVGLIARRRGLTERLELRHLLAELVEEQLHQSDRRVLVEDRDQDDLLGRREDRRDEQLSRRAPMVQVHPLLRARQLRERGRRRVRRGRQRGDVHDLVLAREAVLTEHLAAPVDEQRDAHARLADKVLDRLPQSGDHLVEIHPSHRTSASTALRISTRTRPSCASLRVTATATMSPWFATISVPSAASSWIVRSAPNFADALAFAARFTSDAAIAATAGPAMPSAISATIATPAWASTSMAPRTPATRLSL